MKIFQSKLAEEDTNYSGQIKVSKNQILIGCKDGWLEILELQLEGKKRMPIHEFLNGFNLSEWKINSL